MAWEWSHSQEAYENAKANLSNKPIGDLRIIYAEWKVSQSEHDKGAPELNEQYEQACLETLHMATDTLIDYIWDRMEELRTCDNGGHAAWSCPYGCHTVSFS